MEDEMKHVFSVAREVVLYNVPLRNGSCSENICLFFIVKNDQKCPNKMIDFSCGTLWNFTQGLKAFILYVTPRLVTRTKDKEASC